LELTDFDGGHKVGNPAHPCAFLPHHGDGFLGGELRYHLAQFAQMSGSVRLPFAPSEKLRQAQGFDVGYVAHETGFADQSHFARHFKLHFLATPGSYRKTARFF